MNLPAKVEYACIAMVDLAVMARSSRPIQQKRMAERHQISAQFLVQILQQLKTAGLVTSIRGASGGYQLARPPETITLWDVLSAVQNDGDRCPFEQRSSAAADVLCGIWRQLQEAERQVLQATTLEDLARRVETGTEIMYYI